MARLRQEDIDFINEYLPPSPPGSPLPSTSPSPQSTNINDFAAAAGIKRKSKGKKSYKKVKKSHKKGKKSHKKMRYTKRNNRKH